MNIVESGYIYAIGYEGCVKIGISATNASGRLRAMQTGNVNDLELIAQAYVANYKLIEKALHREHKNRWIRGEWYSLTLAEAREVIAGVGEDLVNVMVEENRLALEARQAIGDEQIRRIRNRGMNSWGEVL